MQFTLVTSVAHHANIQAKAPLKVTSLVKRPSELPEEKAGDAARVPGMGGGAALHPQRETWSVQKQTKSGDVALMAPHTKPCTKGNGAESPGTKAEYWAMHTAPQIGDF